MTGPRIFLHTLSVPEHIWLSFFREFFQQRNLLFDEVSGAPLPNRLYIDPALDPAMRPFDVHLAYDYKDRGPGALPALVVEDTGAVQTGLTINQMQDWRVGRPGTTRDRSDQIRFTYILHCLSRDRGESRMLASMVTFAVTVFRDSLLAAGLVKIEPWSIGATQQMRGDSDEDYVDTPVQITFYTMEHWRTIEVGSGDAESVGMSFASEERVRIVRGDMTVKDPDTVRFIRAHMALVDPSLAVFVRGDMTVADPLSGERFIVGSLVTKNPFVSDSFVRASMRVS